MKKPANIEPAKAFRNVFDMYLFLEFLAIIIVGFVGILHFFTGFEFMCSMAPVGNPPSELPQTFCNPNMAQVILVVFLILILFAILTFFLSRRKANRQSKKRY